MIFKPSCVLFATLFGTLFAQITLATAEDIVYQSHDKNGNLVVGNIKTVNAKKVDLPPLAVLATHNAMYSNHNYVLSPYADKPFMNETTRHHVLNEELTHENLELNNDMKKLNLAKSAKTPDLGLINSLNDSAHEHQQNIALINNALTQ